MQISEKKRAEPEPKPEAVNDFFLALINGQDITEVVSTQRGDFTIKFLTQADLIRVGQLTVQKQLYHPVNLFDTAIANIMYITSYLDVVVVDTPEWFQNAKAKNPLFSFADVPDDKLILLLYERGISFRETVGKNLEAGPPGEGAARSNPACAPQKAVGGGVFEGVSGNASV